MRDNIKIFNDTRDISLNEYKSYTDDLINNTVVYTEEYMKFFFANCNSLDKQQKISICNEDTISCVLNIYRKDNDNHIAMLNFADAYTPGGLVLKGATTQEECICRCSNLYESLISDKCKNDYYDYNATLKNRYYTDRTIYSKYVCLFKDSNYNRLSYPIFPDVITCPAPVCCENKEVWVNRIDAVLCTAKENNIDTLVLGAWGCGAFGNDAQFVASIFMEELEKYKVADNVIFAIPTNDYINVNIDSAVKVKVSSDPAKMKIAASNFLNKNEEYIRSSVVDVLQGNVREIIGQMKLEEIVQDRKKFADKVQENAAPDMAKMGLDIVSFNVQNVTDNGNVIENLGIDRVVSISKSAQISRAESERDIAVAKASAEKQANDARVEAETAIAEQNNALEIKKQELKKQSDIKKAEADAAYEIQEQEQRKTIEIATADANIAKQEKEAEIKEKEIAVKEKSLDAEVKKQADAEKYARIQKADADKYEAEQRAEAEKITKLKEAEAIQARSIAEAEGTKAKGIAEAEAIKAKGLAEAEAMEKKAEAMAKYGKAAMTDMIIKVLPQMAEAIAKPLESIDKVSIIGGAGDSGMSTISDNVPQVLAKTIESVKETTGFDLTEVMKANTYDARVNNNLNITTDLENKVVEKVVNEAVTDIEDNVPNTVAPDIDIAVHNEPVNAPKTHKNKKN